MELHPLLNELILSNIFRHLPLPTLQECRLVCKTWTQNPSLLRRFGSEVTLTLNSYSNLDAFQTFLSTWNNASLTPTFIFRRFSLHFTRQCHALCDCEHVLTPEEEQAALLGRGKLSLLFKKMGELPISINYLKLILDKTHLDKSGLEELLLQNPSVSLNLDTLHIYNLSHRAVFAQGFQATYPYPPQTLRRLIMDEIRIPIYDFASDFLTIFSNIEEITLKCDKRSDWENQKGIWKEHSPLASSIIQGLYNNSEKTPLKLRSFHCGILDLSHFLLLIQLGEKRNLQLSLLEMYCPAKDVTLEVLQIFLQSQAKSLKVLRVLGNVEKLRRAVGNNNFQGNANNSGDFVLQIPEKMEKLVELQFSGRDKDTPIPVQGLNYGVQFPNLKTLIVNGFATNILERMVDYFPKRMMSVCKTLRKLVLPASIRDTKFPENVSQSFPNVIDLELKYPDCAFLLEVFKNFKKLRRLRILGETNLCLEEAFMVVVGHDGLLNDLQNLEITIETEHEEVPAALTDRFATDILCRMKSLRKLVLISCCWLDGSIPCNFLTTKCQQDLIKELQNCVITFRPLTPPTCPINAAQQNYGKVVEFYGS